LFTLSGAFAVLRAFRNPSRFFVVTRYAVGRDIVAVVSPIIAFNYYNATLRCWVDAYARKRCLRKWPLTDIIGSSPNKVS